MIALGPSHRLFCELIPKELIVNRYFQAEQAANEIVRQQEKLLEERGGEAGLLEELIQYKTRIREISEEKPTLTRQGNVGVRHIYNDADNKQVGHNASLASRC